MDAITNRCKTLLGQAFDDITLAEALNILTTRPKAAPFAYAVTANADHLARLRQTPELRPVYDAALLCLLDSQFLGRCADFLGLPRPRVIAGADLTSALLPCLEGRKIAIIGMTPQNFAGLAARYPQLRFTHHAPPMNLLSNPAAFAAAQNFAITQNADFTFIALGSPLQEILAHAIATQSNATGIGLCIGAALEFCAGVKRRAPAWMRRLGLEWAFRLAQEPLRLAPRYLLRDPVILMALLKAKYHSRKNCFF